MFGFFFPTALALIYIAIAILVFWLGFRFVNAAESISSSMKEIAEAMKEKKAL